METELSVIFIEDKMYRVGKSHFSLTKKSAHDCVLVLHLIRSLSA